MTAIDLLADGETWTAESARLMLPILIERAIARDPISYSGMDQILQSRHKKHSVHAAAYGYPAGRVGDVLIELGAEWGEIIPPLNLILVNKASGLPGKGADYYLDNFVSHDKSKGIKADDRHAMSRSAIQKVLDYPHWDRVADHFGFKIRKTPTEKLPIEAPTPPPFENGGESEAHRALKIWALDNPGSFLEHSKGLSGKPEFYLDSGDRIDVLFTAGESWVGIEVKPKNCPESEHWRGVFQCVKYKSVLASMRMAKAEIPKVRVLLMVESEPTARIKAIAQRLQVEWINVAGLR